LRCWVGCCYSATPAAGWQCRPAVREKGLRCSEQSRRKTVTQS